MGAHTHIFATHVLVYSPNVLKLSPAAAAAMQKLKMSYENLLPAGFLCSIPRATSTLFPPFRPLAPQIHNAHCLFIKYPHIACSYSGPSTPIPRLLGPLLADLLRGSQ